MLLVLLLLLFLLLSSWLLIGLEKNSSSPQALLECFLHCMARSSCRIPSVSTSLSDFPVLHRTWLSSLKIKRTEKNQIPYILFWSLVERDSRLRGLHCSKNKKHVRIIYSKKGVHFIDTTKLLSNTNMTICSSNYKVTDLGCTFS